MSKKVPAYSMRVFWSDRDEAFIAVCPELGELSAFGDSYEEAVEELQVAIRLALEVYEEDGEQPPAPYESPAHSGQLRLRLPRSLHASLAREADSEGVSLNTLIVSRLAGRESAEPKRSRALLDEFANLVFERMSSSYLRVPKHTSGFDDFAYLARWKETREALGAFSKVVASVPSLPICSIADLWPEQLDTSRSLIKVTSPRAEEPGLNNVEKLIA